METYQSIRPIDGQCIFKTSSWTSEDIQVNIESLHQQQEIWKEESIDQRIDFLKKSQDKLIQQKEKFAKTISDEMGKPISQSRAEIEKCIALFDYYLSVVRDILKPKNLPQTNFKSAEEHYQALGIIFGIMPWNFPIWQALRFAIPTLLSGNVILLKHAPNVSLCNILLEALFNDGNKKIYKACFSKIEDTDKIIEHSFIQGVSLTGSERAGSSVAALAGKNIKKSLLELGGSDAFIVLEDANLEKALQTAVQSRMINSGQTCISTKRLFVPNHLLDKSLPIIKEAMKNYTFGDIYDSETTIGYIARPDLVENLQNQIKKLENTGAKKLGQIGKDEDNFVAPRWYLSNQEINKQFQEELFGPILQIFSYSNEKELIQMVNNTPYGLGCAIWGEDKTNTQKIALQVEAGSIAINTLVQSNAYLPFGGIKKSGFGRELGPESLLEFVNKKIIYSL
jgi:succinate-semialdehyde dehydrogenase/glutarate-semialdehyde dehydrogenase